MTASRVKAGQADQTMTVSDAHKVPCRMVFVLAFAVSLWIWADTQAANHAQGRPQGIVSALRHPGQFKAARIVFAVFLPGQGVAPNEACNGEMWFQLQKSLDIGRGFIAPAEMA